MIIQIPKVSLENVNLPLNSHDHKKLLDWLNDDMESIQFNSQKKLQEAQQQGLNFSEHFNEDEDVMNLKRNMKFLIDHDMVR